MAITRFVWTIQTSYFRFKFHEKYIIQPSVRRLIGGSVGGRVGRSVDRSVGQSVGRSVGRSVVRSVCGQSVSRDNLAAP